MKYQDWIEQEAEAQRREERQERIERFLDGVQFEAWAEAFEDGDTAR